MFDEIDLSLSKFRLEQSHECLTAAKLNLDADLFTAAANRSYYCIFHAIRSVLALDRFDSKKHSGVISMFRQKYIKTHVFPTDLSTIIESAFTIRNNSDYEDFFVLPKADVVEQIDNAKLFLDTIENYLNSLHP